MTQRKSNKGISMPEADAKTTVEKSAWAEARMRSEALLELVKNLHSYLHGEEFGDPSVINSIHIHVGVIYTSIHSAILVRLARSEQERTKTTKDRKKKAQKSSTPKPNTQTE